MATATEVRAWLDIDRYIQNLCVTPNEAFEQALREAKRAQLPPINISPNEGKLLYLLAKIAGARRILEIGTLGGYSALWFASALPVDGQLVTLEVVTAYATIARQNLERAGLLGRVDIRLGDARHTLDRMIATDESAFDIVFIDADKEGYPAYLDYALQLTHSGSLILADNVIRDGKVATAADESSRAIHEFNQKLAGNPRLETILLPVLRGKVDGLAIARVL